MDVTQMICVKYVVLWALCLLAISTKILATRPWKLEQTIGNGPIYTFVKTDKNANIKWGIRHYIPRKTAVENIYENS